MLHGMLQALALLTSALVPEYARTGEPRSHIDELEKGPPRPPAQAYAACNGKTVGDSCELTFRGKTLSGTCVTRDDPELMCMPNSMPAQPAESRTPIRE